MCFRILGVKAFDSIKFFLTSMDVLVKLYHPLYSDVSKIDNFLFRNMKNHLK